MSTESTPLNGRPAAGEDEPQSSVGEGSSQSLLRWPTWLGVVVEDLEAMTRFYRDILGFRQTGGGEDWVHFEIEGKTFEILQRSSMPEYDRPRYQVGYTVDDIERVRERLVASGVEAISGIEDAEGTLNRWCYFRDPEGNVFEITEWKAGVEPEPDAPAPA